MPHITLKSIANNAEIDVIWEHQAKSSRARALNARCAAQEAVPREGGRMARSHFDAKPMPRSRCRAAKSSRHRAREWESARGQRTGRAREAARRLWQARIARQKEIDASIAAKAEFEYLYDKPYDDKKKVRVAGPFTVESLCPHRVLGVDENDELIDPLPRHGAEYGAKQTFAADDPGEPQDRRRAAGAQGRPDHLHRAHALARRAGLRRRPLPGRRRPRSAPPSSSAPSSAPSSGRTSSPPRARPATPASTC